jgi:hexosaminidase
MIEQPVNLFDTASTIAYLFGLKQPYEWIGRPVLGAFEIHREFSEMNQRAFLPKPKSSLKSGLYMEPKEISFIVDADHAEIRYTLDGSEPDMNSPVYQSPILLEKSAVLTAVSVKDGVKSIESVTDFTRIRGIKDVFLKNEPDSRYPSQGVLSLVDGQRGSNNHRDGTWMGFEEDDLEMTIDFGERRTIRKVTLGCLENEESWIFLPVSVELFISETGEYFRSAGKLIKKNRDEMAGKGINNFTREVMDLQTRYLRIKVRNIGKCPEGHPGAGRKAWLFVDEIIIE